jgi:hypothetical protein
MQEGNEAVLNRDFDAFVVCLKEPNHITNEPTHAADAIVRFVAERW